MRGVSLRALTCCRSAIANCPHHVHVNLLRARPRLSRALRHDSQGVPAASGTDGESNWRGPSVGNFRRSRSCSRQASRLRRCATIMRSCGNWVNLRLSRLVDLARALRARGEDCQACRRLRRRRRLIASSCKREMSALLRWHAGGRSIHVVNTRP